MNELLSILFIAVGGFLGGGLRYTLSTWLANHKFRYPMATLLVNIVGSFLLGYITNNYALHEWEYILFGIGFMGSFTTFSTFKVENVKYILEGKSLRAMEYILISYAIGITAAYVGFII